MRNSRTVTGVAITWRCSATAVRALVIASWASAFVGKPALVSRRRSSVSLSAPPHFGTASLQPALDPEAPAAALAALRCPYADIDDVLIALLAAPADVAAHLASLPWKGHRRSVSGR